MYPHHVFLVDIHIALYIFKFLLCQVIADSETLCSSFFALEQMIFYMAHETTTLQLDSKEILQVHSALQGAVSALLYFLSGVADSDEVSCVILYVTLL